MDSPTIHAKRRRCVSVMADAGSRGNLSLMGISRALSGSISIRHRIKRCDRILGNGKLDADRLQIYKAMTRRLLQGLAQPLIIVDWSDLHADRSQQLLRAAFVVKGRAQSPIVHREFLHQLKNILPVDCHPIFVTDAGFRSP